MFPLAGKLLETDIQFRPGAFPCLDVIQSLRGTETFSSVRAGVICVGNARISNYSVGYAKISVSYGRLTQRKLLLQDRE